MQAEEEAHRQASPLQASAGGNPASGAASDGATRFVGDDPARAESPVPDDLFQEQGVAAGRLGTRSENPA